MHFKLWLETWYHGTRRQWDQIGDKQRFGGIHLGTRKAALQRLDNTPSQRIGGKPGPAKVYSVEVNLKKPYNTPKNPVSEHDIFMWLNMGDSDEGKEWQNIRKKYDGVYYTNNIEDPGSISVLVFDKSAIRIVGEEDVIA